MVDVPSLWPDRIAAAHDAYPIGSGAARVHETYWAQIHPLQPLNLPGDVAVAAHAVRVTVNDGRWTIVCPLDDNGCNEGQLAAKDDPRFLCIRCLNVGVGGKWRPVIWPKDHAAIERELMRRSAARTRNWRPGETIGDLQREALDQVRPSVPRLEDLPKKDAARLRELHDKLLTPLVSWEDDERTTPLIEWPSKAEERRAERAVNVD